MDELLTLCDIKVVYAADATLHGGAKAFHLQLVSWLGKPIIHVGTKNGIERRIGSFVRPTFIRVCHVFTQMSPGFIDFVGARK